MTPGEDLRARLQSARLYLCTDSRAGRGDLREFVAAAVRGGVEIVQVREKGLEARAELELLAEVRAAVAGTDALVAVNDRADLAVAAGADVLHLGQDDLPVPTARTMLGPSPLIGLSTHSAEQAATAARATGLDYFCVGPCWPTPTKPGRAAPGLDLVRTVAAQRPARPWFAIGGIDRPRLDQVVAAGATRIVVVRAITEADDPEQAARDLRAGLPDEQDANS